MPRFCDNL